MFYIGFACIQLMFTRLIMNTPIIFVLFKLLLLHDSSTEWCKLD